MSAKLLIAILLSVILLKFCPTIEFSDEVGVRDDTHGVIKEIIIHPAMCKARDNASCQVFRGVIVEIGELTRR